jgi:hypothetical protein
VGGRVNGRDGQVPDLLGGGCVDQGEQPGQRLVRVQAAGAAGPAPEQFSLLIAGEAGTAESPRAGDGDGLGRVGQDHPPADGDAKEPAQPGQPALS